MSTNVVKGQRVRLVSTDDPISIVPAGTEGRVTSVDGSGTVHVQWDDGSRLGMIPGIDQWEVLND